MNAMVEMEKIPAVLKCGVVVPIYKGGRKDPLNTNSYRGVTLTSVTAKVLEFLVLERMQVIFLEAGIPHRNQTAYQKDVSCADAIFSMQEVIARYMRGGSRVFMCLYDLQKASDSVEYSVLLERLFEAGISGKLWRLLKNWYEEVSCYVKIDGKSSEKFKVERRVRQGSVLSPSLFLLVMDPLLR